MMKHLVKIVLVLMTLVALTAPTNAQTNLLQNPNADLQSKFWRVFGQATVEPCATDNPCFVVRNGGYFIQDVTITADAVGSYALLIARASAERINPDGAITGLPSLYGYMMEAGQGTGGNIFAYLQGQDMSLLNMKKDDWSTLCGVFQVPVGTGRIRFFLSQAERQGVPHNGSAARFDNVGLYLFATEDAAREFANAVH